MTESTPSPFRRLTPQNECEIREIQTAAARQGIQASKDEIISEALRVTRATDYSSAIEAYRARLTQDRFLPPSQCRAASNSRGQ